MTQVLFTEIKTGGYLRRAETLRGTTVVQSFTANAVYLDSLSPCAGLLCPPEPGVHCGVGYNVTVSP